MNIMIFAAVAAMTNAVSELPTVTVYASRIEDAKDDIPASVQVFGAEQIAASGARDLPELLKKKAGVDIHAMNGNPILTSIAMRGFGDNAFGRVKVVLDGEELNNVDMGAPNLTRIPLGNVERVEVIHGPSPVLYGDGAVAGVVNVTTDTRDYEQSTKITGKAGSQYTFGGNVQTKGGDEEEGVLYSASYDYLQSDGYRKNSEYEMHTANAGVRKNFANGSTAGLKVNYQNAYYGLPGYSTCYQWKNARKSASTPDDWARIWSYGVSLDSKMKLAEGQWLYLDGSFSHQNGHPVYKNGGTDYEYDYCSCRVSPRYVNECDVGVFKNKFTVGIDFRYDLREEEGISYWASIDRYFSRDRYAAFVHDEFFLMDELSLVAGVRLERIGNRWRNYPGLAQTRSHDWMDDYELGLVYRPVDGLKTYIKGSQFHRSAFCDELSYTPDGNFLEPETGASLDLGLEWSFADEFMFMANGYGMVMENEIFCDPILFGWKNGNSPDKTRRIGLDTGFSWFRDKVAEASVRYNAVHADFADGEYHGNDVPYVPNNRIRLEGGFWIVDDLKMKGGYTYASSQFVSGDYANAYDRLPAYSLFDVGVYYEPSWAEGWMASFVMDNIFDRNYCDYAGVGYYYPACGRSFMFTVSYEF